MLGALEICCTKFIICLSKGHERPILKAVWLASQLVDARCAMIATLKGHPPGFPLSFTASAGQRFRHLLIALSHFGRDIID